MIEVERKFLVNKGIWSSTATRGSRIRQGYVSRRSVGVVRIRIADSAAFLTLKSGTNPLNRLEFEYPIPVDHAEILLNKFCEGNVIEKIRYTIKYEGMEWIVDEFEKPKSGLIIAEIELRSEDTVFEKPIWLGREVTHDPEFLNHNM